MDPKSFSIYIAPEFDSARKLFNRRDSPIRLGKTLDQIADTSAFQHNDYALYPKNHIENPLSFEPVPSYVEPAYAKGLHKEAQKNIGFEPRTWIFQPSAEKNGALPSLVDFLETRKIPFYVTENIFNSGSRYHNPDDEVFMKGSNPMIGKEAINNAETSSLEYVLKN